MREKHIAAVLVDIRSAHNVGSIFRTADALGIKHLYLCGFTPYPSLGKYDKRLPHIRDRATKEIAKTALGAEKTVPFTYFPKADEAIKNLKKQHYTVIGLELTAASQSFWKAKYKFPLAFVVGNEVAGLSDEILKKCDAVVHISMLGKKESLNVGVAFGVFGYELLRRRRDEL